MKFDLFSVPMFGFTCNLPHEEIRNSIDLVCDTLGEYTSYFDTNENRLWWKEKLPHRKQFEKEIVSASNFVLKNTNRPAWKERGGVKFEGWCSRYSSRDYHTSHNHPLATLSGTYWPCVEKNAAPIIFEAPYATLTMHDPYATHDKYEYFPKTGDMLIWPSWLKHYVPMNRHGAKRYAISFNLDYANNLGQKLDLS